jgi:hypothetical protein
MRPIDQVTQLLMAAGFELRGKRPDNRIIFQLTGTRLFASVGRQLTRFYDVTTPSGTCANFLTLHTRNVEKVRAAALKRKELA